MSAHFLAYLASHRLTNGGNDGLARGSLCRASRADARHHFRLRIHQSMPVAQSVSGMAFPLDGLSELPNGPT